MWHTRRVNLDTFVCRTDRQNAYNAVPILRWMRAMMVLMAMVTKRLLQLRPLLEELHNLEAPAIQSVSGASGEKTEALSLSREKAGKD